MAKRSNGEGTIYKRKDGKWCACKYITLPDGTVKRKYIYGKTQKAVKDRLKEFDELQNLNEESTMLLQDWLLQWLDKYKKGILKQTTYENYQLNIRVHITDSRIGKIPLNKITTGLLQSFYNGKLDGTNGQRKLSRRTVEYLRTIIGSSLEQAYKNELVVKNVNDATVLPRKNSDEIVPLTMDELHKVIEVAKESDMYALILTEIYTGLRKGELLGLRWKDVDFDNHEIHVRHNLCRVNNTGVNDGCKTKLILMEPKTKKSIRTIPLSESVVQVLKHHRIKQQKHIMKYRNVYLDNDVVFPRADGTFDDPREVLRRFHNILEKANVRKCRFHDLRHTFASILLNEGESMKVIQELLGHSTITTTMDIYSHVAKQTKKNSIELLEKAVNQRSS